MHTRTYAMGGGTDHDGDVAELHWDDGRVVQISGAEDTDTVRGKHVLIRVWPVNGTAENGGSNITSLSIVLEPHGDDWAVTSLNINKAMLYNE